MGQKGIRVKRLRNAVLQIFGASWKNHERVDAAAIKGRNMNEGKRPPNLQKGLRGDLSLHLPNVTIFVTVDRSGGIAHLAKYWQYLEQNWDLKTETVVLFYIFLAPSHGVINARQALWNFTLGKVKNTLGNRFEAFFGTCERPPHLDCHTEVPREIIVRCQAQLEAQGILDWFQHILTGETQAGNDPIPPSPMQGAAQPGVIQGYPDKDS